MPKPVEKITYREAILKMAREEFSEYMGGSNQPGYGAPYDMVADIFGKTYAQVSCDVDLFVDQMKTKYYAKQKAKNR